MDSVRSIFGVGSPSKIIFLNPYHRQHLRGSLDAVGGGVVITFSVGLGLMVVILLFSVENIEDVVHALLVEVEGFEDEGVDGVVEFFGR